MDCTVPQVDEMCIRIDQLAEQIAHPGFGFRDEQVTSEVVQFIQRVGESIAWAYGQHNKPGLGEQFAQPFVDRRLRDVLKSLLTERKPLRRELQNRIAAQVLQTIHILLQATPTESTLFCNLTAGWYLNGVVAAPLDFRENEDLLPLWMTVVKDIATMLDRDNMMLFFDERGEKPFPIFTEAIRFYHHPVSQVRTHVQATSLEIFLKLRDENVWVEPIFQLVLRDAKLFFTHVSCLLRDFWKMADDAVRSGQRRDVRSALYIQNDILMYVNDVFACEIPQLSEILQEKLLRFAVLPVLVRSVRAAALGAELQPARDTLAAPTAWYLLHDLLATLSNSPVLAALSFALLRSQVPEEVLQLVVAPPPRTPTQYYATQASWGVETRPGPFVRGDTTTSDEALYAMPAVPLVAVLDSRDRTRLLVQNRLLEFIDEKLKSLCNGSEAEASAPSMLGAVRLLLRALRAAREALDGGVAERLGTTLCDLLALHSRLQWATLEGALAALTELAAAADAPLGRARLILGPRLRERVLFPLAADLQAGSKQPSGALQDAWLLDFQEQWNGHKSAPTTDTEALQRQRDILEQGALVDTNSAPEGRARCIRVLLGAWRLAIAFSHQWEDPRNERMPGLDEAEAEETGRFQPGVPVHIGKMNRVKCYVRRRGAEPEAVYLLPTQATFLLVRPDEQKPFWAVPVVAEPLRMLRLVPLPGEGGGGGPLEQINSPPGANGHEPPRVLNLEVFAPRSPLLRTMAATGAGGASPQTPLRDRMANSLGGVATAWGPNEPTDGLAMSMPAAMQAPGTLGSPTNGSSLTLMFSDDRRRRLACKILAQARHAICQRMAEGINAFLVDIQSDLV